MEQLRSYLHARSWLVAAVVLSALCLRMLTPQGYMPAVEQKAIEILVCHGAGEAPPSVRLQLPPDKGSAAEERCAFADLAMPMLGTVDPIQLALALSFILALWLTFPQAAPLRAPRHLRPPLRGPPTTA